MKKFLLVTMIGLVLVMDLYGIINQLMIEYIDKVDHVEKSTITVYLE